MSHVSMNIIQQIYDESCAIYQVVQVYAIYQYIELSIYQAVNNQWYHEAKIPDFLPMVIRLDHCDHL